MKQEIFNQTLDKVSDLFGLSTDEVLSKTKKREVVDARQLLYYLCNEKRSMQLTYIQNYMQQRGYNVGHSSIHHGIAQVKDKMELDKDYRQVVERLEL